MKKRFMTLVSFLLVFGLVIAACAPAEAPEEPAPPAAPGETPAAPPAEPPAAPPADHVTITIWSQWEGTYLGAIRQSFQEYEAQHDNVTIIIEEIENVAEALRVAIPAGEGPDIIGWANDQIGTQALVGNIVPLEQYGIDMAFLEQTYEPAAVNGVLFMDQIWGLPEAQEGIAIVYNRGVASEADFPADPLDFNALLESARTFRENNPNMYLFCNQGLGTNDAYHVAPIYFGHGVPEYIDDEGNVYLDTPEAFAAGEFIADLRPYHPSEADHEICRTMLFEQQAAAWWTGPWAIADLEAEQMDYDILPMGRPFTGIKVLLMTQNAVDRGNAEVAIDIMRYFTSYEPSRQMSLANRTIPANSQALEDPEIQALPTLAGFGEALNLGVPMSSSPYAGAQWDAVGNATLAIMQGVQEPEQALRDAQAAAEARVAEMR
jgi:arabinogalactan oligomer / maltooligosaccharide transport system substrate-binding protein